MIGPEPRHWNFVADMDLSGSVTIGDIVMWVKWLYFYPGDGVLYLIIHRIPARYDYIGMTDSSYYGVLSGVISTLVWFSVFHLLNFFYPDEE